MKSEYTDAHMVRREVKSVRPHASTAVRRKWVKCSRTRESGRSSSVVQGSVARVTHACMSCAMRRRRLACECVVSCRVHAFAAAKARSDADARLPFDARAVS
eukprot:5101487-Pleurochrysis_carterae.AAC.2